MHCRFVLFFCLLLVSLFGPTLGVSQAIRWNRNNAQVLQNGSHIVRLESSLTFYEPTSPFLSPHSSLPNNCNNTNCKTTQRTVVEGSSRKRDSGWVTSAWSYANITYYSATWKVPPAPTADTGSNIIFYFNSLENSAYNDILQPVLTFNNIISGWSIASWYGDPSGAYYHSTPVPVSVGDTILGVISLSNNVWSVLGYVNGSLRSSITVSFATVAFQASAQFALEVYDVTSCAMYPPTNSLTATGIVLKNNGNTITPSWSVSIGTNECNAGASFVSNGNSVQLSWTSGSRARAKVGDVGVDRAGTDLAGTVNKRDITKTRKRTSRARRLELIELKIG